MSLTTLLMDDYERAAWECVKEAPIGTVLGIEFGHYNGQRAAYVVVRWPDGNASPIAKLVNSGDVDRAVQLTRGWRVATKEAIHHG